MHDNGRRIFFVFLISVLTPTLGLLFFRTWSVFYSPDGDLTWDWVIYSLVSVTTAVVGIIFARAYTQYADQQVENQIKLLRATALAIQDAHAGTLEALSVALDHRDHETHGHSRRVVGYALATGRRLHLIAAELQALAWGALLHDIGKMSIPDAILHKPGPLTDSEMALMREHVVRGYEMVRSIGFLRGAMDVILYHHERWDGRGYVSRVAEEQIPLKARIFAIADAFDAMTSRRVYRKGLLSLSEARVEVERAVGSQFCPTCARAFLQVPLAELEDIRQTSLLPTGGYHHLVSLSPTSGLEGLTKAAESWLGQAAADEAGHRGPND